MLCSRERRRAIVHLHSLNGRQLNVTGMMQGILINGQFPGPQIDAVTNDNIIVNVFNNLPVPFLLSW